VSTRTLCVSHKALTKIKKIVQKSIKEKIKSIKIMRKLMVHTLSFLQIRFLRDTRRIKHYPQTRIGVKKCSPSARKLPDDRSVSNRSGSNAGAFAILNF